MPVFKRDEDGLGVKQLLIAASSSIIYASTSILFDPRYSDFVSDETFGELRPAIFFPALIAVLYGPLVGGLTAGIGNLLFDVTTSAFIGGFEPVGYGAWVGFAAYFIGGAVAGLFAKAYHDAATFFDIEHHFATSLGDYFDMEYFHRLARNTISSVIGLAFITGLFLGYTSRLLPGFEHQESFDLFVTISYLNGIFLLVATPLFLLIISLFDYFLEKRATTSIRKRSHLDIKVPDGYHFDIVTSHSPEGDELWNHRWGALLFVLKNTSDRVRTFMLRISSNDLFSPHRHTTPSLKPGETDEMYFNIYGISPGLKRAQLFVSESDDLHEVNLDFTYEMGSSNELIFDKITGIFLIIGFAVSAILVLINLSDRIIFDRPTILALLTIPMEILLVIFFYWFRYSKLSQMILELVGMEEKELGGSLFPRVDTDLQEELQHGITEYKYNSKRFLLSSVTIFSFIAGLIILEVVAEVETPPYLIVTLIFVLLISQGISDYYLEKAEHIRDRILTDKQLKEVVIRSAVTRSPLHEYETSELVLGINNPFATTGMRIYLHSIDNISPRYIVLPDLPPQTVKTIKVDFTPLQKGRRELGFEFVQLTDKDGEYIPEERARTIDQETLSLHVSAQTILGLSKSQINIIRKLVTTVSAVTIALGFLSRLFQIPLDRRTLETTIPLIIIMQSPVVWLILYFQNKISNRLGTIA